MNKTFIALGVFALLLVGGIFLNNYEDANIEKRQLTQENYKAMVLSRIVPIGYGTPNDYDIDTKLNLNGESGEIYRLYESGKFPTEGQLFVTRIA